MLNLQHKILNTIRRKEMYAIITMFPLIQGDVLALSFHKDLDQSKIKEKNTYLESMTGKKRKKKAA